MPKTGCSIMKFPIKPIPTVKNNWALNFVPSWPHGPQITAQACPNASQACPAECQSIIRFNDDNQKRY